MADYKDKQFFGTAQSLMSIATDTAAGNFTAAGTVFDNTTDASVPYAKSAVATVEFAMAVDTTTLYPDLELWGVIQNVDGTSDDTNAPSGANANGARLLGRFTIASGTALQRRTCIIDLNGIKAFEPYIRNGSAQVLNNDTTTLTLKVTPFTSGVTV